MHVPLKDTLTAKKSKIILSFVQYTLSISKTKISDLQPRQDDGHSRSLFHMEARVPHPGFRARKISQNNIYNPRSQASCPLLPHTVTTNFSLLAEKKKPAEKTQHFPTLVRGDEGDATQLSLRFWKLDGIVLFQSRLGLNIFSYSVFNEL